MSLSSDSTAIGRQIFSGIRFTLLTRIEGVQTLLPLITKAGGVCTRNPSVAEAPFTLALADEALLSTIETHLMDAYSGRIHGREFVIDSIRRKQIQDKTKYLIGPGSDGVHPAEILPTGAPVSAPVPPSPARSIPPSAAAASSASVHPAAMQAGPSVAPSRPGVYSHQTTNIIMHSSVAAAQAATATHRPGASTSASGVFTTPPTSAAKPPPSPSPPAEATTSPVKSAATSTIRRGTKRALEIDDVVETNDGTLTTWTNDEKPPSASKKFARLARASLSPHHMSQSVSDLSPGRALTQGSEVSPSPVPIAFPGLDSVPPFDSSSSPPPAPSVHAQPLSASNRVVQGLLSERKRRKLNDATMANPQPDVTMHDSRDDIHIPAPGSEEEPSMVVDDASEPDEELEDRQMRIDQALAFFAKEGFSRPLVMHALLASSGSFRHARAFLRGELDETNEKDFHFWTAAEDRVLGSSEPAKQIALLMQSNPRLTKEMIQQRCRFLDPNEEGLPWNQSTDTD